MKFILLLLIICSNYLGYSQKSVKNDSTIRTSKTIIELEDAKTIFKEKKNDWWDKYSSGLIAAFTVFVSLGISVWQARSSQKHTKANIISEARVEWVQKLRPHLGDLITDISKASIRYKILKQQFWDTSTNDWKTNLPKYQAEVYDTEQENINSTIYNIVSSFNQVKLFLNRDEKSHSDLIKAVDNFMNTFMETRNINALTNDLIEKAQIVLKDAWEQAKQ
ncbi:hypothetical protein D3C87_22640 [compost metagenome]